MLRGVVVVSPGTDGYGFVEPDCGGGEVLFRSSSVSSGIDLQVGASVRFALAHGSFALEAVAVTPSEVGGDEEKSSVEPALVGAF